MSSETLQAGVRPADSGRFIGEILAEFGIDRTEAEEKYRQEIEIYKREFKDEIRGLAPQQVSMVDTIRGELDDDAIVISGVTNVGYWSNLAFPVTLPRTYLTSSYFGTLGYAFPTGLGAKLARPDRQVVALCGDGGFLFNPQELSTSVKYGINLVSIVFNNGALIPVT